MKKSLITLIVASSLFYTNAQAQNNEVIKNIGGVQVSGCELIIDNEKTYFGININNIVYYKYDKQRELFLMRYNDLYNGSEMKAEITKATYKEEMRKFVKLRNRCTFMEQMS